MAGRSTYDAWNGYLGGKLGTILKDARAAEQSFGQISRTLYRDHDIDVSQDTVRRWCLQVGAKLPRKRKAKVA